MSEQEHFLLITSGGWIGVPGEYVDDTVVLAHFEDLSADEARSVRDAVEEEAARDPGVEVWVENGAEAQKKPGRYLNLCRRARQMEERLRGKTREQLEGDSCYRLALAAVECADEVRKLRRPPCARYEVYDVESGTAVAFDEGGTEHWGPVHEGEDWDPYEEMHMIDLCITVYRHPDGHWTLVTERTHREGGYLGPGDAQRLGDADAADWLVRHGFDPPSDVAHLAAGSFFKPGTPAPRPPLEQSLIDRTDPAGNQDDAAPRSGKRSARNPDRLTIDITTNQAVLDGHPYSLTADGALLLDSFLRDPGEWVAGKTLDMRAERVKKSLPKPIRDLIEASPGKGHRIPRNVLVQPCQDSEATTPD